MSASGKKMIVVVAGGSGGHIFPAIAFCEEVKDRYKDAVDIVFVTSARAKMTDMVPKEFNPVVHKSSRNIFNFSFLFFSGLTLIGKMRPDLVFGFGGLFSVPFLLAAKVMCRKTYLHEQNVVPGKANKFLSLFVDRIVISFKETERYFKIFKRKVYLAQYPLRKSLKRAGRIEALNYFGFSEAFFTVLVVGGSQGAHRLNEKFVEALKSYRNLHRLQVIHVSGPADVKKVEDAYRPLRLRSKVFAFLKEMNYAYSIADLVISRSGAGCVNEITRFGLPSVLIPYPYAGAHQIENAKVLASRGAAILLEDNKMSPEIFNGLLDIFIDDSIRRKTMTQLALSVGSTSENLTLADLVSL